MKVDLPSGHTAEFRDVMMRGDIRACKRGIVIVTSPDGSRSIEGSFLDDLTGRVVACMMTAWDFGQPLPREGATEERRQAILDTVLDSKDWKAISAAVGPWVEELLGRREARHVHPCLRGEGAGGQREGRRGHGRQPGLRAGGRPGPKNRLGAFRDYFLGVPGAEWPDGAGFDATDFDLTRRHHWTPDQIDALPAGWAEDHVLAYAGWDEAVEVGAETAPAEDTPPPTGRVKRPIYGMPGVEAPGG